MHAGHPGAMSVVPRTAQLVGTVRTFRPEAQDLVERRLGELCSAVALGFGATATVHYERMYPATVNTAREAAFAAELLDPSPDFWVVSPWLSDVPVLDNSCGVYTMVCADFARSRVSLSQVLAELMLRGANVHVVTRPDEGGAVVRAIVALAGEQAGARLHHIAKADLHVKVILGRTMAFRGSMNLTYSGLEILDELESVAKRS